MTSWLLGTSILLIHLLGVVSAIMALMSSRTSQGAVAWIISLLTSLCCGTRLLVLWSPAILWLRICPRTT